MGKRAAHSCAARFFFLQFTGRLHYIGFVFPENQLVLCRKPTFIFI